VGIFSREGKATAAAAEVELVDGEPPRRVQLFPMGVAEPNDGRTAWLLEDRAHAEAVIDATRAHLGGRRFMFDYDHQAETAPKVGGRAVASGWADPDKLVATDDGIFAEDVEWTAAARQHLVDREYRYISPWFGFEKKSGRLTRFFNAALTNRPALELTALASAHASQEEEDNMSLTAIAAALSLGAEAGEEQILASIQSLKDGAATASTSTLAIATALALEEGASVEEIATAAGQAHAAQGGLGKVAVALGLEADADVEAVATAAAEAKASAGAAVDPAKFVPIDQYNLVIAKVAKIDEGRATAAVDDAINKGLVAPAARDWAISRFKADEGDFNRFIGCAAPILKPGEEERGTAAGSADQLTDEEKAAAATLQVSEADFVATKKALR